MNIEDVKLSYREIIDKEQAKHAQLSKTIFKVGTLRLLIVVACVLAAYLMWENTLYVVASVLVFFVFFIVLMKYHSRLFNRRLYSEIQIRNAENELNSIAYDFSAFDGAAERKDSDHNFSFDLDLFGDRSFFQSMNRSVTSFGKEKLVDSMLYPLDNKSKIVQRQEAIKELRSKFKLMSHFRTIGRMSDISDFKVKDFSSLEEASFYQNKFWTVMVYIVPALYLLLGALCLLGIISSSSFIYLWVAMIVFSSIPMKHSLKIYNFFDKKTSVLDTYSQLFEILEKEQFSSELLVSNQARIKDAIRASQAIAQLKSFHNNLGLSASFPVILFFNPVLLWNVRYALKIEEWIQKHNEDIGHWFESIAEFDSLISMAIFAYNHPKYIYPEAMDSFVLEGRDLGHPLINRDVCVKNDVNMPSKPYFLVVTGANMAGKSTYLRTIGINHMLACVGMPVCAGSLKFYPGKLVTNLRTADSLADNESYFFAELKRLKMIIDKLQAGEELFIILDEILKGTNSEDKQKGSLSLMRQLIQMQGNGIIATHDLLLGNLENEFPKYVKDYCFEAEIKNDQLSFSYKMQEGVAQNMNACFLMKKMGITGL